ncbi:MAG: EAL domain-containing protein, partial [Burkholderiaceae bacterium]
YRAPRAELLAAPPETLVGKTVHQILPPAAAQVCMAAIRTALERGSASGAQFELPMGSGSTWFELSVSRKSVAAGDKPRFIVLSREITERKVAEARIARLAYFDSLTGLPNRYSFLDRVNKEIARAGIAGERLAVLFMDLDGFKNINDTMGHASGDLLLQWAAARIRDGLRPSDVLSRPMALDHRSDEFELARLGGDEFTALILGIEHPDDAAVVARRIGAMMRTPFVLEGRHVTVTTSVGIAIYPDDGSDGATLLKHADTAMYHAKQAGRDNAQAYRPAFTSELLRLLELDTSMRTALEQGQFHLVYQPQIDVASGRIRSVEALIRWTHPVLGVIPPLDFIPRAEENGLIDQIGLWVLRAACAQAVQWSRAGAPVTMAVNLSPRQFRSPQLQQSVMDVLAQTGMAPGLLELEVTEGALMDNTVATRAVLKSLNDAGVSIALDDFGTGYSSLAYLTRMPIGNIKVDKCFVAGLLEGGENEAIVRAILAMAHSLGTRVTAEGVETLEQARALKAMACDCLQGYYFSRPVAASDIPVLLARQWLLTESSPSEKMMPA